MKSDRPLLLRNATVLDGSGKKAVRADIHVQGRRIRAVGASLPLPENGREIALDGRHVSPGWIDLHTHVFADYGLFSVEPREIGLGCGVTTVVDAGSAGALNYPLFSRSVIAQAKESIFAYVNIASAGLPHGHAAREGFVGDHFHPALHSEALAESLLEEFSGSIVGWKARLTAVLAENKPDWERHAFSRLLSLRDRTSLPVMVHHIESAIPADDLVSRLLERDVYTHLYHGRGGTLFDPKSGRPSAEALAARDRGVVFDVGHGSGAFQWECAEKACRDFDFWPDTISSDLHRYNLFWPVCDLATTMSKFLHLGLPLERVIAMVTGNAAAAIGRKRGSGLLEAGEPADLTIFEIHQGAFELGDAAGSVRTAREKIVPLATFKDGEFGPCHGFYHQAGSDSAVSLAKALQAVSGI